MFSRIMRKPQKKDHVMDENKEKQEKCKMHQKDTEGNTNLCCCYMLDQNHQYEDPCHLPVDDCCC